MQFYDKDEIIAKADCADVAQKLLGLKVENNRCAASWRGGDGMNVHLERDKWYDHGPANKGGKIGGSAINLVMKAKNCDFPEAVEILGEFLNLKKSLQFKQNKKKVAEDIYYDKNGNPLHKTVRYETVDGEEKTFLQFHFEKDASEDKKWVAGLNGIETVPYRLPEILKYDTVFLHEGEKPCKACVNAGFPNSTTLPMGSGKWFPYWAQWFKDKHVVILRDNDDAGYAHGARLAWELKNVVKSLKMLTPSKISKGDCYEYFSEEKGTAESFKKLIEACPILDSREISEPKDAKDDIDEINAKEANKTGFANYFLDDVLLPDGTRKTTKRARNIKEMLTELNVRLMGFPRRVGSVMFDRDHKTGQIRPILSASDLIAWIAEKTGKNVRMGKIEAAISAENLFSSIYSNCKNYSMISGVPHYPLRDDVYYTYKNLPDPTPDAFFFNKFCSFFCPASFVDSLLIKIAVASPLYYSEAISKPIFVIDSTDGAGVGKSKFVDTICHLYGDPQNPETFSPIDIQPEALSNENSIERVFKRILSSTARQKRIIRIDNASGFFKSDVLSTICTSSYISGMSPYARGEEARANDLSIFITSNNAQLSSDFVSRGFIIKLRRPDGNIRDWEHQVKKFLEAHQYNIIADIMSLLSTPNEAKIENYILSSRFKVWEDNVMLRVLRKNEAEYKEVWNMTEERRMEADGELFEAEIIRETLEDKVRELWERMYGEFDHMAPVWINWDVVFSLCRQAIPGIGGKDGRGLKQKISNAITAKRLLGVKFIPQKFPTGHRDKRKRGLMWDVGNVFEEFFRKKKAHEIDVKIVKFENEKIVISGEQ